ncbi:WD40/YVTN/BNR-like repeat-containing protein [Sphingobacterium humi]|uniref:Oxidoreductase n=1 Tax=Sphingobacterium humi TaxID=1796905 RepID=A0A6N8KW62_9SPHI|nr:YCF48-related protein [Sphingobacterium humi]MVZ61044.1 oxidoreductase [Sphingobacterium humi]
MKKRTLLAFCCLFSSFGYAQHFHNLVNDIPSSFRGLETYKEKVIWVSGSRGTVGKSVDAGKTWQWVNPKGYEGFDFRDIEVFSAREAVIVNAGSPAVILHTKDGGKTWKEVYRDERKEIFLDGMDFLGKTGYIYGDPIDGAFQLLKSTNKGKSWQDVSKHIILFAEAEEGGFAASGTGIQVFPNRVYMASGGRYSSFYNRNDKENSLDVTDVPIWSGESGTGIFSIDFLNPNEGIAVGGNYMADKDNRNNILLTKDAGKTWQKPQQPVGGYRSCVKYISPHVLVATGTSGTDLSRDGGQTWTNISPGSFNVIAVSKSGKHIYLAGSNGNIERLDLNPD